MSYKLDEELTNIGVDDLSLIAKRAELARRVYTHFPEETELNLGNFRGHEAEALWELGQREQAESLYQELIETYPNFAWGYIWWGKNQANSAKVYPTPEEFGIRRRFVLPDEHLVVFRRGELR